MSDYLNESEFYDERMLDNLGDVDVADIQAKIAKLQAAVSHADEETSKLQATVAKVNADLTPLNEEEAILQRQLAIVRDKRREAKAAADEAKRAQNRWSAARVAAQRQLQTLLAEKSIRDEWDILSVELDDLTRTAAWREHAYPHQIEGAKRLVTAKRAICGDKRGLGKTLTSLIYLDMSRAKRVLIITPRDVSGNFLREIQHWTPNRRVVNMVGINKDMRDFLYVNLRTMKECTVILNYEAWRRDPEVIEHLIQMQFDTVVIDEAHNLKNHTGMSFKGLQALVYAANKCPYCGEGSDGLSREFNSSQMVVGVKCDTCQTSSEDPDCNLDAFCSVVNVLPMSGTTIINRPQDIWPLLHLVDRNAFPDLGWFLGAYAHKDETTGKWVFDYGGQEKLIRKLGSRYIGRTPQSAGVVFPPQENQIHELILDKNMYPQQYRVMKEIYEFGQIQFDPDTVMPMYAKIAEITRRRQGAVWPAGIQLKDENQNPIKRLDAHESIKLDKAMDLIDQILNEEEDLCVVVFSKFKEALKELEDRCKTAGISAARYDGDTPEHMREQIQLDFDIKTAPTKIEEKRWRVFLGQYDSAATGLNLTAARQMILTDRNWSPANEDQAVGRIQRLDSVHDSIVHILELGPLDFEDLGIDEFMSKTMEIKAQQIDGFEGANAAQEELFRKLMGE